MQITSDVCDTNASDHTPPMTPLGSPMQCPWSDDPFQANSSTGAGTNDSINPSTSITAGRAFAIDEELGNAIVPPQPVHSICSIAGPSTKYYHATSTTIITSPSPPRALSSALGQHDTNASTYRLHPQTSNIHYHRGGGGGGGSSGVVHGRMRASSTSALRRGSAATGSDISVGGRIVRAWHRFTGKLQHMDPVKLAYLRTSFVFAISVLVTWTPSSINRVYNLIYPERISYGLNIASAAVLPLQGVWNAIIYFSTSWKLLHEEIVRVYTRSRWVRRLRPSSSSATPPASRRRIPGIIVDSHVHHAGSGGGRAIATEMGTVLSPVRSHPVGLSSIGSGSGSGSQRAFAHSAHDSGRPHHHHHVGIHGMCYGDDDSTESDSLDGAGSLDHAPQRYRPAVPATMDFAEPSSKSPPRIGTIRVQRGGQFDA